MAEHSQDNGAVIHLAHSHSSTDTLHTTAIFTYSSLNIGGGAITKHRK